MGCDKYLKAKLKETATIFNNTSRERREKFLEQKALRGFFSRFSKVFKGGVDEEIEKYEM